MESMHDKVLKLIKESGTKGITEFEIREKLKFKGSVTVYFNTEDLIYEEPCRRQGPGAGARTQIRYFVMQK